MKHTKEDFKYFVIYSIDCPKDTRIRRLQPRNLKQWTMTEGDDHYQYSYLEGTWRNGKHRKYFHEGLSYPAFEKFVSDCQLTAEDVETMGSLSHHGHLPAISFSGDDDDAITNAYVTPYIPNETLDEESWNELRTELIEHFE